MSVSSGKRNRRRQEGHVTEFQSVKPRNYIQGAYLEAIMNNDIVFGIGSAGTGKTFIPAMYAAEKFYYKDIDKIVLTRPNVEAGPSLGYLPGELEDKYAPYLEPFAETLKMALGESLYEHAVKRKQIEPIPLGFLRGRTFNNAIVLIDECQNIEPKGMELILSRIGDNCKMIFSGDTKQKDINGTAGIEDAVKVLEGVKGVEVVRFTTNDIVRSEMCKKIIKAYEFRKDI